MSYHPRARERTFVFDWDEIHPRTSHATQTYLLNLDGDTITPSSLTGTALKAFIEALPENLIIYQEYLRRASMLKIFCLREQYPDDLAIYQELLARTEGPIEESSRNLNALLQRPDILPPDYEERLAAFREGRLYPALHTAPAVPAVPAIVDRFGFTYVPESESSSSSSSEEDDAIYTPKVDGQVLKRRKLDPIPEEEEESAGSSRFQNTVANLESFLSVFSSSSASIENQGTPGSPSDIESRIVTPSILSQEGSHNMQNTSQRSSTSSVKPEVAQAVASLLQNDDPMSLIDPALRNNDLYIGRMELLSLQRARYQEQYARRDPLPHYIYDISPPDSESESEEEDRVSELEVIEGIPPPGYRSRSNSTDMAEASTVHGNVGSLEAVRNNAVQPGQPPNAPLLQADPWTPASDYAPLNLDSAAYLTNGQLEHQTPAEYPEIEEVEDINITNAGEYAIFIQNVHTSSGTHEHRSTVSPSSNPQTEHIEDISFRHNTELRENTNATPNDNSAPNNPPLQLWMARLPEISTDRAREIFGAPTPFRLSHIPRQFSVQVNEVGADSDEQESPPTPPSQSQSQLHIHTTTTTTTTITQTAVNRRRVCSLAGPLRPSPVHFDQREGVDEHLHVGLCSRWTGDGHRASSPAPSTYVDFGHGEYEDIDASGIEIPSVQLHHVDTSENAGDADIAQLIENGELAKHKRGAQKPVVFETPEQAVFERHEQTEYKIAVRDAWGRIGGRMTPTPSRGTSCDSIYENSFWKRCVNRVKRLFGKGKKERRQYLGPKRQR